MPLPVGDAEQAARYLDFSVQVENAVGRPLALGGLRQWVTAADLADEDRNDLLGRIATYLGDSDTEPWDDFATGGGPLPGPDAPRTCDADPEDDAADALLDVEDGFVPLELPDVADG